MSDYHFLQTCNPPPLPPQLCQELNRNAAKKIKETSLGIENDVLPNPLDAMHLSRI